MNHTFDLISSSLLCFAALLGFVYGMIRFFRPRQALYKKMVTCAIGCLFIERLYGIEQILVAGDGRAQAGSQARHATLQPRRHGCVPPIRQTQSPALMGEASAFAKALQL